LVEALSFYRCRDLFHTYIQARDTSALEIYKRQQTNVDSNSTIIERVFFLREPAPEGMEEQDFIPVVASQLLTILICMVPNLTHLGISENSSWLKGWQFDISIPTLEAFGVHTLPITQFESDRALDKLLSRSPYLEAFITRGKGDIPSMPNVRSLHLRSLTCVGGWGLEHSINACNGHLSTFSYTSVDLDNPKIIRCLDQPRLHATLESIQS
jgi:hypothetical protein